MVDGRCSRARTRPRSEQWLRVSATRSAVPRVPSSVQHQPVQPRKPVLNSAKDKVNPDAARDAARNKWKRERTAEAKLLVEGSVCACWRQPIVHKKRLHPLHQLGTHVQTLQQMVNQVQEVRDVLAKEVQSGPVETQSAPAVVRATCCRRHHPTNANIGSTRVQGVDGRPSVRHKRDAFFFGCTKKSFFGIQKIKVIFWIQKSFWGSKMLLSGHQKIVLDIFASQRGLINCFIVIDILEGQKRGSTVGDPKSSSKSSREQQHTKQEKQHKQTEQQKAQTTGKPARSKLHKQQRISKRISNSSKATQTTAKAAHQEEHNQ